MEKSYDSMEKQYTIVISLSQLFPRARSEIFLRLFEDPSKEYHLRELARLSGLTVGAIQSEIANLREGELIVARKDGNRLAFRANTQHPLFPEIQGLVLKTSGMEEKLRVALAGIPGIRVALIFGSVAGGTAKAGSDIDLLAVGSAGLRALSPRLRPLAEQLGREINPHCLSPETFLEKKRAGDAFIREICAGKKTFLIGSEDEFERLG